MNSEPTTRPVGVTATAKPFRYYGGKARLARRIVAMFPPHRAYLEPFLGSGAVICAKPPASQELVNDLDHRLVTFFRVLRDRPEELARVCQLTPYARNEYDQCRGAVDGTSTDLETARRFFAVVSQSFAASTRANSGWSTSLARNVSPAHSMHNTITRFAAVAERLARVQIECRPAWDVIDTHGQDPSTLIYCDPPYVHATRSGGRSRGNAYRHEMTDKDHERLAESLHATQATVLLSGYPSPLYQHLYPHWSRVEISTKTTVTTAATRPRTEVLWSNRPLVSQLTLTHTAET